MIKFGMCVVTCLLLPVTSLSRSFCSCTKELADRGYICSSCRTKYTMFDADRLFDPFRNGFFCEACGAEVVDNNQEDDDAEGSGMCFCLLARCENWLILREVEERGKRCSDSTRGPSE
jgi:hypothetical protein